MFGLKNKRNSWTWAAYGKHPTVKDYFTIQGSHPFLAVYGKWLEKGYKQVDNLKKENAPSLCWRIWTRGPNDEFVCGIITNSEDKLGRKYPLLIMGTGFFHGWQDNWDLIPYACEKTWNELESLVKSEFSKLRDFKKKLYEISLPVLDISYLNNCRRFLKTSFNNDHSRIHTDYLDYMNTIFTPFLNINEFSIKLNINQGIPLNFIYGKLFTFIKNRTQILPRIIFLNGPFDYHWLIYIQRSLTISDFKYLWTDSIEGIKNELFKFW